MMPAFCQVHWFLISFAVVRVRFGSHFFQLSSAEKMFQESHHFSNKVLDCGLIMHFMCAGVDRVQWKSFSNICLYYNCHLDSKNPSYQELTDVSSVADLLKCYISYKMLSVLSVMVKRSPADLCNCTLLVFDGATLLRTKKTFLGFYKDMRLIFINKYI